MAANTPFLISKVSQEAVIQYHRNASVLVDKQWNLRESMEQIDRAYIREEDMTKDHRRAEIANIYGDSNKYQNITVPVIKPQVKAAVAYQAAVFLTDYPIFGLIADPKYQDQALQMQAVIEENSVRGSWVRELLLFFQDGFKYNISAIELDWCQVATAALETDPSFDGGRTAKPKNIIWSGNKLKRWNMYNTYFDSRCEPYDIPTKGEFAGTTEIMSRTALKAFINALPTKLTHNIAAAFNSPSPGVVGQSQGNGFYLPQINPNAFLNQQSVEGVDWLNWMGVPRANPNGVQLRGLYEVSTEYVRIIPSDFAISAPQANTPQVWKFIIVNHSVVIHAERQTNAHEKIPVLFGCPSEDGLGYQTKSLAQDAKPFQNVASTLMNSVIAGRRRAATDRVLYDPSRIDQAKIESSNPSAKIPVRPSAYGKPVGDAVFPFPYRDDQAGTAIQEIQTVVAFGNILNGQNAARQGQFVKGNKTDGQWETTMSNATSSDQMTALLYEAQVFTPLKEMLKLNILQYQSAGEIYSPSQGQVINVDPLALRKAVLNFKVTDGLLPSEKVMSTDTLQIAMQVIGSSEAIGQNYNVAPMFSYLMKTENVNLAPFEKSPAQVAYEQAMGQWTMLYQLAIQKQAPFNVPQPTPQAYGYDPNQVDPARQAANSQTTGGSNGGLTNGNT